jgi:UrcA family protein
MHMRTANTTRRICQIAAPLFASLALPIVTASVASAADTILPNGRAVQVSVADLNLSTIEGQTIAGERVGRLARSLCNRISDHLDLGQHEHWLQCVVAATDQAMGQIRDSTLARASKVPPLPAATAKASR